MPKKQRVSTGPRTLRRTAALLSLLAAMSLAVCPWAMALTPAKPAIGGYGPLLHPADYEHYVQLFEQQELAATGKIYNGVSGEPAWPWMQREIPWFDCSNKQFEEMYYFRWYAWKKHLVKTPTGYIITEWLPKPNFKDGSYGALPDAAGFHLGEARWLRTRAIAEDDARYWFRPGVDIRKYSDAMATAVWNVTLANGDSSLATDLLPRMVGIYHEWESTQRDSNGLFWSIDTRDGMEKSISGDGYRPTLNSYMYADARSIADVAEQAGKQPLAAQFSATAEQLRSLIRTKLWNPKDQFFEVVSPAPDSGIRTQKKFKDNGTALQFSGVRELIGYIPWMYAIPTPPQAVAWRQLFNPQGFDGRYGATTAERRSPRFRFPSSDQCTWNGPAWPFAMTQTLEALAEYEDNPAGSAVMHRADYYKLFARYVAAQHLSLADGRVVDWIDEDYDADTDEWIAKNILIRKHKQVGRGNYYNQSGFADPLITGLIGLRPQQGNTIVIHPLLPARKWSYFAIDALPYHGHMLTIAWDSTGKQYGRGKGMWLAIDGHVAASRPTLGPLRAKLPPGANAATLR